MTALIFECPRTRGAIDAGIQMDKNTLAAARPVTLKVYCPHCRSSHELPLQCGRLYEARGPSILGEAEPPKAPALTIAINALRISWLKRGLRGHKA
jgi:hypothetical protein